jgi:hypothetical protein
LVIQRLDLESELPLEQAAPRAMIGGESRLPITVAAHYDYCLCRLGGLEGDMSMAVRQIGEFQ